MTKKDLQESEKNLIHCCDTIFKTQIEPHGTPLEKAGCKYGYVVHVGFDEMTHVKKRVVMVIGTYPEDNYADFEAYEIKPTETDFEAINKARNIYGKSEEYYIMEK